MCLDIRCQLKLYLKCETKENINWLRRFILLSWQLCHSMLFSLFHSTKMHHEYIYIRYRKNNVNFNNVASWIVLISKVKNNILNPTLSPLNENAVKEDIFLSKDFTGDILEYVLTTPLTNQLRMRNLFKWGFLEI